MADLASFLLTRIAEDRAAAEEDILAGDTWSAVRREDLLEWTVQGSDRTGMAFSTGYVGNGDAQPLAEHIARWDPARVLAECEAKRRIVDLHRPEAGTCVVCVRFHADTDCENEAWPCPTLRVLALPYSGHPEYDETWRPA